MWPNPRIPFELANNRKRLAPLHGKPLMVHLAMNIEYWPFDRQMPRGVIPAPHGAAPTAPDIPNYSWVEYGMRCGMPRILEITNQRGLPASAFINAQVADVYPDLVTSVLDANWDLVGHGWFQQTLKVVDDEREVIETSLAKLADVSGKKTRSWLGCGLAETYDTPDIVAENGVEFIHDWALDDLPNWMWTKHGPVVALPYTFELNDVPIYAIQNGSSDEILKRLKATLAVFEREVEYNPRVITFGLHPHIVGVPHVAHQFEKALDVLMARDDVVFVNSAQLGDWFVDADGTSGANLEPRGDWKAP